MIDKLSIKIVMKNLTDYGMNISIKVILIMSLCIETF